MNELLEKTQQYLNYIADHYNNVLKAWEIMTSREFSKTAKELGYKFGFLYLTKYNKLSEMIKNHDASKMSVEEFIPYRKRFYPTKEDLDVNGNITEKVKEDFKVAWANHKRNNYHHWEMWTSQKDNYLESVHNFVDWFAMSLARNQKPLDYYREHSKRIKLPKETIDMFNKIEECLIEMGLFD